MGKQHLAVGVLLGGLLGAFAVTPLRAEGGYAAYGSTEPRHHYRDQGRMPPPYVTYRSPRVRPVPQHRPDFLFQGYLPRLTEKPIYNEPPSHFATH